MARDLYGSFGGVPERSAQGGPMFGPQQLSTNANMFGQNVGEAQARAGSQMAKAGDQLMDKATEYAAQATEAKVNDTIANVWAPQSGQLRARYDELTGRDKVAGYETYIQGLRQQREDLLKSATGPYERELLDKYTASHLTSETVSAQRELAGAMTDFEDQAMADLLLSEQGWLENNYNDPAAVDQTLNRMDGLVEMSAINKGLNPENPADQETIAQQQQAVRGSATVKMVNSAVSRGDLTTAYDLYHTNRSIVPGYQQLAIDGVLGAESIRQNSKNYTDAIINGKRLPPTVGAPPDHIQAAVVRAADLHGVAANDALTVAYIESNMGQNVGKRGDIGQTGKGGDIPTQAANMAAELKRVQGIAATSLGRTPEPWETYVVYQQGEGGGPALFKAAREQPMARAVDVLRPLYKNPKNAFDAIVHNGGNASMTAGQFLDFLKTKYRKNESYAACELPKGGIAEVVFGADPQTQSLQTPEMKNLADAIMAPHEEEGIAMQPASSPRQQLVEFNKVYAQAVLRAQQIPNLARRKGVIKALNAQRSVYQSAASAYSSALINEAQQLAVDPSFTSLEQVPAEMMSSLLDEHPETINMLERRANYNLEKQSGQTGKYQKDYGSKYYDLFRRIHAPDGDPNKINSVTDLYSYMNEQGDLTPPGLDQLTKEFSRDPISDADGKMREQAFKVIKRELSGQDDILGIPDPRGEALFAQALPVLYQAITDGQSKGLTMGQLTDPTSNDYIGLKVQSLKRTPEQMQMDMLQADTLPATEEKGFFDSLLPKKDRTRDDIIAEYYATSDVDKRKTLRQELIDKGFAKTSTTPTVPVSE